jgi:hypothetical protein
MALFTLELREIILHVDHLSNIAARLLPVLVHPLSSSQSSAAYGQSLWRKRFMLDPIQ